MSATEDTPGQLGSEVLGGAVGGGLFGGNLTIGEGVLDAERAMDPPATSLANAMIIGSLAGAGAILVNEARNNQ